MDPDPDPGGPKTCGSGSATLEISINKSNFYWRLESQRRKEQDPFQNVKVAEHWL
jgi:hypothetical protein